MAIANATIQMYAYISGSWVLLDDTGGANPTTGYWGMRNNNPLTRVANTGSMTVTLNNSTGIYSPNGVSALAGWKKGIPLKMVITFEGESKEFKYYISDIDAKSDDKNKKAVVTCVDWLDYAARHPIVNPGIQTNKRGDEVLTTLLGLIEVDPDATDFDTGIETFPTVLDTITSQTKAYTEAAKIALSELGFVYLKKDGTLVFESSSHRSGWNIVDSIPLANADSGFLLKEDGGYLLKEDGGKIILNESAAVSFDSTNIFDYDAPYGKHVINRLTVYANPRKLSAAPEILFQLDEPIAIGSGQTVTIKGSYANPDSGLRINAQDMITPVVTTDYLVNTLKTGAGTNISADLVLTSTTYGTEGFTHQVTNNNASGGFITKYNYRGTGIYIFNQIEHAANNAASITEFEAETETLNQKYKNDLYSGIVFSESIVDEHNQPRTVLNSITFYANKSSANMMAFLYTDVGSLHYISMDDEGLSGNYYIQGTEYKIQGGVIMVKWIVAIALSLQVGCGLSPISAQFHYAATDAVDFGYLPKISNITYRTDSAWIYASSLPAQNMTIISQGTTGSLGGRKIDITQFPSVRLYEMHDGNLGAWVTPDGSIASGQWYLVTITRDVSTITNKPIMYLNAVSQIVREDSTPSGAVQTQIGKPLFIGNDSVYVRTFDGKIFDPRIYNRILTQAEVVELYNAGVPSALVGTKDGLVFQGMAVRTENLANYIDQTLDSTLTLRDNVFGAVGVPHGSPVGRVAP
jgi:hypothetical protein